ncbi:MAG: hypothetical protein ABS75_24485 [Pelagibacterium sp. SCN 63-23]|nr:MAG: hypothetical protein ABS75_24485 [Pelagibacterium sp. SCN 63-23]
MKPNVLIFMTDQQNGKTILEGTGIRAKTPNLDRFRRKAVTFSRAYAPSPHCCPSRASFFTGRYPSEHGVWNNVNVTNALSRGPRPETPFWSRDLKAAGYDLGFCGKWHVSNFQPPAEFGWDECHVTAAATRSSDPHEQWTEARAREVRVLEERARGAVVPVPRLPGEIVRPGWPRYVHFGSSEDPFGDEGVVASAQDYLRLRGGGGASQAPWCLYVGTLGPHDPYTPPQKFIDLYDIDEIVLPPSFSDPMSDKPGLYRRTRDNFDQLSEQEHRQALLHYLAFCSYEDDLFGRLLETLEATGQQDNTIIVYASDHGDYAGEHGLWGKGLPAFSSAYHVPMVVGGAAVSPDRRGALSEYPISLVDFAPTLLALCGTPSAGQLSGVSFAAQLYADGIPAERSIVLQSNGNEAYGIQRTIMRGRWKLVHNMFDFDELYDLERDPDEITNLIAPPLDRRQLERGALDHVEPDLREIVRDLYEKLWRFSLDHDDENINGYIITALAPFGPGIAMAGGAALPKDER